MTMDDTVREKIGTFKVFEGLSSDEIDAVIACGTVVHFKGGEKIIEESAESTDLYVVLNGRVSIEMMVQNHSSPAQRAKQMAIFRIGEVFGDIAFLRGARRSASVTTIDDFSAMAFDRGKLYGLFDMNNHIGYIVVKNLAKIMSNRLMELNFMLRDY